MEFVRKQRIQLVVTAVIVLIGLASPVPGHSATIQFLSQTFSASAAACGVSQLLTSSVPFLRASGGLCIDEEADASVDGSLGSSSGYISVGAGVVEPGGAGASGTVTFRSTVPVFIHITVNGECLLDSDMGAGFGDLTDHLTLFSGIYDFSDVPIFLGGSFDYQLDPSKVYSIGASANAGGDFASAGISYTVTPVPEPGPLSLLLAAFGTVVIPFSYRRKAIRSN